MRYISICLLLLALAGCAHPQAKAFGDLKYPFATSTVNVDGIEVAYHDEGQGPRTLLLIHGLGSYQPVWIRNLPELAAKYRVVTIDLPGYGKSSKANYKYSMAFFADVVDRVISELKLEHVVLVGHSMGGQIALTHALRHPGRVDALVLTAPAGIETFKPGEGDWLERAITKDVTLLAPPETVYANMALNFVDMPREAQFMVDDRVAVIGGPDFDAYAYAVSRSVSAMVRGPVADRLGEIKLPTLIIFGENDGHIPNPYLHGGRAREIGEQGAAKMPHAKLVMIPHAAHMVQFEQPQAFDAAVLEFVQGLPL